MPSFTISLTDSSVHNLRDLLKAAKVAPAYEFGSLLILADKDNGAKTLYVGGPDLDMTSSIFSYSLGAAASRLYPPVPLGSPRIYTSTIYVQASDDLVFHVEGTY